MTNTNVMSDSQESALMDEETYKDIERQFGGTLPLPESINGEPFAVPGNNTYNSTYELQPTGKIKKLKEEEQEEDNMYPASQLFSTMLPDDHLNFQLNCSLGTGGAGQDWLYSEKLGKVYIKMEKVLPMRFTWEPPVAGTCLCE